MCGHPDARDPQQLQGELGGHPMPRGCPRGLSCWHPVAHNPQHVEVYWVGTPMPRVLTILGVCWVGTLIPEPPEFGDALGGHPPQRPESSLSWEVLGGHPDARAPQYLQSVLGGKPCPPGFWGDLGWAPQFPELQAAVPGWEGSQEHEVGTPVPGTQEHRLSPLVPWGPLPG